MKTGKSVDVSGGSKVDDDAIIIWKCHGGKSQRWRVAAGTGQAIGLAVGNIVGLTAGVEHDRPATTGSSVPPAGSTATTNS